jgi:hypothetical protein
MTEDNWIFFKDVDFDDEKSMQFHVDTRDFRVMKAERVSERVPDLKKILKYPARFFRTPEEVAAILVRLYEESGGEKEWRHLSLSHYDGWDLKYLRIYRTQYGLLICNSNDRVLGKSFLDSEVINHY